jgi:hypothetical protein
MRKRNLRVHPNQLRDRLLRQRRACAKSKSTMHAASGAIFARSTARKLAKSVSREIAPALRLVVRAVVAMQSRRPASKNHLLLHVGPMVGSVKFVAGHPSDPQTANSAYPTIQRCSAARKPTGDSVVAMGNAAKEPVSTKTTAAASSAVFLQMGSFARIYQIRLIEKRISAARLRSAHA